MLTHFVAQSNLKISVKITSINVFRAYTNPAFYRESLAFLDAVDNRGSRTSCGSSQKRKSRHQQKDRFRFRNRNRGSRWCQFQLHLKRGGGINKLFAVIRVHICLRTHVENVARGLQRPAVIEGCGRILTHGKGVQVSGMD